MREQIEPLIAERAPWLVQPRPLLWPVRAGLDRLLGYEATVSLAQTLANETASDIMRLLAARLARKVQISGLENIPRCGPALIVANHPTGIGDGIILWHALSYIRRDLFFTQTAIFCACYPRWRNSLRR